jgi:hypothetical protein
MLTTKIVRDVHEQQLREIVRSLPETRRTRQGPRPKGLRLWIGRRLIGIGVALAAESPPRLAARR